MNGKNGCGGGGCGLLRSVEPGRVFGLRFLILFSFFWFGGLAHSYVVCVVCYYNAIAVSGAKGVLIKTIRLAIPPRLATRVKTTKEIRKRKKKKKKGSVLKCTRTHHVANGRRRWHAA